MQFIGSRRELLVFSVIALAAYSANAQARTTIWLKNTTTFDYTYDFKDAEDGAIAKLYVAKGGRIPHQVRHTNGIGEIWWRIEGNQTWNHTFVRGGQEIIL